MKLTAVTIAFVLAAAARAQSSCASVAANVPSCATKCIAEAAGTVGCGATDFACTCNPDKAAKIQAAAQTCVLGSCGPQAMQVVSAAEAVCQCVASAGSGSGSTSPTSAAAAPAASAGGQKADAPGSSAAAAGGATSAAGGATSAAAAAGTSMATASPTMMSMGTGTGALVPTSTLAFYTGAAAPRAVPVGGVFGALLAIAAAL